MAVKGPVYQYTATVVRVIDGDTIVVDVDLGFRVWLHGESIRLLGCNARELSEPGGPDARDHLAAKLPAGTAVTIRTVRSDKYGGRWDADVVLADGADLVAALVAGQWAAPWNGRGAQPVPPWPRTVSSPEGGS